MRLSPALALTLTSATALSPVKPPVPVPIPTITNITYSGSACPADGLSFTLPPSNTTNTTTSLTFSLANFAPTFDNFGSSLRMCNAVLFVAVAEGWKAVVNARGTTMKGDVDVPSGARVYWRGTWAWAGGLEEQSVGMFDAPGPLAGSFTHLLTPVEGSDGGVASGCGGGESELDVEFQARAVNDTDAVDAVDWVIGKEADERWTLTTDVEVVRC